MHKSKVVFFLPALKYLGAEGNPYKALEPYIDERTLRIHHGGDPECGGHHQIYTNNINGWISAREAEGCDMSSLMTSDNKYDVLKILNTPVTIKDYIYARNNMGGYYNHSLMWATFCPASEYVGEDGMSEEFLSLIKKSFGGFDKMRDELDEKALTLFGSGWSWLSFDTVLERLVICASSNQNSPLLTIEDKPKVIPILGLDVWEHAYYIKHNYKRPEYIGNIRNVIDWKTVDCFYTKYASKGLMVPIEALTISE